MTPPADARLRDDLVQRLRARALIEAPDEHMSIEDIEYPVEVTSGELAEIAALFREAADALAAVSSSQTWQPDALQATIQILRATLADFAMSRDMSLTLLRKKALRVYRETAQIAGDEDLPAPPASGPDK